jgi:hypothetical protein
MFQIFRNGAELFKRNNSQNSPCLQISVLADVKCPWLAQKSRCGIAEKCRREFHSRFDFSEGP